MSAFSIARRVVDLDGDTRALLAPTTVRWVRRVDAGLLRCRRCSRRVTARASPAAWCCSAGTLGPASAVDHPHRSGDLMRARTPRHR